MLRIGNVKVAGDSYEISYNIKRQHPIKQKEARAETRERDLREIIAARTLACDADSET